MFITNSIVLLSQVTRDRDADLRRQLAELTGGEREEQGEHHLTARLGSSARLAVSSRVPASAPAPAPAAPLRLLTSRAAPRLRLPRGALTLNVLCFTHVTKVVNIRMTIEVFL